MKLTHHPDNTIQPVTASELRHGDKLVARDSRVLISIPSRDVEGYYVVAWSGADRPTELVRGNRTFFVIREKHAAHNP